MSAGDSTPHSSDEPSDSRSADSMVENYLDHLYAPLVGRMPYSQRRKLRAEAKDHLLSLIQDKREAGQEDEVAVTSALEQFGHPRYLAGRILLEWRRERTKDGKPLSLWNSFAFAFACCAGSTLLSWAILLPFFLFDRFDRAFYSFMGIRPDLVVVLLFPLLLGGYMGYYRQGRLYLATFLALSLLAFPHVWAYQYAPPIGHEAYGGSIYDLFLFSFGMYWLPLCFLGIALGRLFYRSLIRVSRGRPRYRQLSLT